MNPDRHADWVVPDPEDSLAVSIGKLWWLWLFGGLATYLAYFSVTNEMMADSTVHERYFAVAAVALVGYGVRILRTPEPAY